METPTKPSAAAIKCAEELIKRKDLVDVPMNVPAVELAEVIDAHMKPLRETVARYLEMPSLDGRMDRQELRRELTELIQ